MQLIDLFEQDSAGFREALQDAKTPEQGIAAAGKEVQRLLLLYNEKESSPYKRSMAAAMTDTLLAALPLMDAVEEARFWKRSMPETGEEERKKKQKQFLLFGAVALFAALFLPLLLRALPVLATVVSAAASVSAAVCFYQAGSHGKKRANPAQEIQTRTEMILGPERVYSAIRGSLMVMDQRLQEAEPPKAEEAEGDFSEAELDFLADLLEASYSGDGAFALERLKGLSYLLYRKGITLADASPDNEALFERIPGDEHGTVRPAMLREEKLLRKGLLS